MCVCFLYVCVRSLKEYLSVFSLCMRSLKGYLKQRSITVSAGRNGIGNWLTAIFQSVYDQVCENHNSMDMSAAPLCLCMMLWTRSACVAQVGVCVCVCVCVYTHLEPAFCCFCCFSLVKIKLTWPHPHELIFKVRKCFWCVNIDYKKIDIIFLNHMDPANGNIYRFSVFSSQNLCLFAQGCL